MRHRKWGHFWARWEGVGGGSVTYLWLAYFVVCGGEGVGGACACTVQPLAISAKGRPQPNPSRGFWFGVLVDAAPVNRPGASSARLSVGNVFMLPPAPGRQVAP